MNMQEKIEKYIDLLNRLNNRSKEENELMDRIVKNGVVEDGIALLEIVDL